MTYRQYTFKCVVILLLSIFSTHIKAGLGTCDDISQIEINSYVDFEFEIQPIFDNNCTFCHSGPNPSAFLDLSLGYADLVDVESFEVPEFTRVEPGVHFSSYLFLKINCANQIFGGRMPLDAPPLNLNEQALIRDWINQLLIFSDGFE